ncbi:atos homolog atossa [Rhynchophorus ferrugineus]|uniref:Atos-like conserved domain-containing protein n=1 Tax=Rhynchophorus ferrugineus TaxID=354439 RepID=A0A834HUA7_RHYFE|nr:hypothetical protein GWI33_019465 [Rhynchophorus ferrugineus]
MHSATLNQEISIIPNDVEVLSAVATLVTEGRIPGPSDEDVPKSKHFHEGPHCPFPKKGQVIHQCNRKSLLCQKYKATKETVSKLTKTSVPLCVEVFLTCPCNKTGGIEVSDFDDIFLLEQWNFSINDKKDIPNIPFNFHQLVSAVRSQLYFSQLTAWLVTQDQTEPRITGDNLRYRLTTPDHLEAPPKFGLTASRHDFPVADLGDGRSLNAFFFSAPRSPAVPDISCAQCRNTKATTVMEENSSSLVDDRMYSRCTLKGKHRCDDVEEGENNGHEPGTCANNKRICQLHKKEQGEPSEDRAMLDLKWPTDKGQLLLDAIERSGRHDHSHCDMNERDIFSVKEKISSINVPVNKHCDNEVPVSKTGARKRISFEGEDDAEGNKVGGSQACDIPSATEQAKFRRNLGNAASMVFHSRTGLPLTSSPAPVRKGQTSFDFDSTLNSVSAIKSALFSNSFSTDDESESEGSIVSPCSPEIYIAAKKNQCAAVYKRKGQSSSLLGSFEESVLNGRLEPVSTVHGFTAELGASGSFVPKHVFLPVTVFFYSFGDNDQVSSPYLGHINLGKKGYNVPKSGTVQVTLFNPLGTVVKMFVIMYDLSDMPPNSQTFIRQRTLYMPTSCQGNGSEWGSKWLRYVIHLRFMSSKSNKIYLHSDIRMIVSKKSDMDTATAHGIDMSYELRSFIHSPTNPRFSPRK